MPISRWTSHLASFFLGAALATTAVQEMQRKSHNEKSDTSEVDKFSSQMTPPGTSHSTFQSIKMMPSLPIRIYQPNPNLLIAFDTRTRNPSFVIEHLTSKSLNTSELPRRNKRFYEEQSLPPYFRSRAHQYRNSGYDRGHLAPAADYQSSKETEDTFCFTNVSPQYARLNRGMWLRLENFVRGVVRAAADSESVWVVTGPCWLPNTVRKSSSGVDEFGYSFDGIGKVPSLVSVPTHFFKVIVVVDNHVDDQSSCFKRLKRFAAFVLPNNDMVDEIERDCLMNYTVRLTDLEAVSGLEFFPEVLGSFIENTDDALPLHKIIVDALTDEVRFNASTSRTVQKNSNDGRALVPLANNEAPSKSRQRKIKQILRDNSPIQYQHLCKDNTDCTKLF